MTLSITSTNIITGLKTIPGKAVAVSGSVIDLALGDHFVKTISTNTELSVENIPGDNVACNFVVELISGSSGAVTWWEGIKWSKGKVPVLTTRDVIKFSLVDGEWHGVHLGQNMKGPQDSYWINLMGGTGSDYGYGIAVDGSGNVYVTGYTNSQGAGNYDVLITKYDTSGTLLWQRTLGGASGDYGYGIALDSSGNVYVTGITESQGAGDYDVLIAKYDTSGTLQWQRVLGGTNTDQGWSIAVDSSGDVYITGYTFSQGAGNGDFLIAKYNTSGTLQWQRTLGGANSDVGVGIAVDTSGNVYVAGGTSSQGAGGDDVFIAKYNTSGTLQWQRMLGGASDDDGVGIAVDSSGNVYVTGYTNSQGVGGYDVLIAKYNTSGSLQWQRTLGGANNEDGYDITVDSSGNVYVTGYTSSLVTDLALVAKLPGNGDGVGSYFDNTIFYTESGLISATSTLTSSTSTLTSATSTLTSSTSTLTDQASTLLIKQDIV